jgi:hypothetical protein
MAPPKRKAGGRVTPKGQRPGERRPSAASGGGTSSGGGTGSGASSVSRGSGTSGPAASSRYTPPVPRSVKHSAPWVPYVMFALLIAGALVIVLNYIELLPGAASNLYLILGLVLILIGILTATQYR